MAPPGKGTGRPAVQGIHNSYCAGVGVDNPHTCARRNLAAGTGGQERQTLPQWDFVFEVACKVAPVAEVIEHMMAIAVVVAHRVALAVDKDSFEMEAALHTGWVAVAALPALFHSLCKIAGQG